MSEPARLGDDPVAPLGRDMTGCKAEIVRVALVSATDESNKTVNGADLVPPDLTTQIDAHRIQREAEAAEIERKQTIAAEEKARKDAIEAERQRKEDAELQRKQAEEDARLAKLKAQQDAKAAAERERLRAACKVIYANTIDTKVKDLTVREEQQLQACRVLGMYPPR